MTTESSRPYIGGQAVLEGVMMRAPQSFAIVLRRRDGSLLVRERPIADERVGWRRLPLARGVMSLVESLRLGSEALRFSAEEYEAGLEEEARRKQSTPLHTLTWVVLTRALGLLTFLLATTDAEAPPPPKSTAKSGVHWVMLLVAVGFFVALPQAAAEGLNSVLKLDLPLQSPAFQAITGGLKLCIVVTYLLVIRRVPDIRRVFQYHGAEHKTISTYEAGLPLEVAHARPMTTLHPRCGTTFLVMVALISILVFTVLGGVLPRLNTGHRLLDNIAFLAVKIPFLPVIAAITFEVQRLFARYFTKGPLRAVLLPGFAVQKITTIEPDDAQLEVALASLHATLFRQEKHEARGTFDVAFASYEALRTAKHLRT